MLYNWNINNDYTLTVDCLLVKIPVGYTESDNIFKVNFFHIIENKSLPLLSYEENAIYIKCRNDFMVYMKQTKRIK